MTSAFHSKQTLAQGIHSSVAIEYADSAARLAATGFDSGDLYKIVIQLDDLSLWLLYDISPISWAQISNGLEPQINFEATKATAGTIVKGQAVYIAGYDTGNNRITIELARSNSSTTMPSIGIAAGTITDVSPGTIIISGFVSGIDTSGFSENAALYISSSTAGALVATPPTGTNFRQQAALVARVHASDGIININMDAVIPLSDSAPSTSGASNSAGTSANASRSDHTHAVNNLSIASQTQGDVLYFNGTNWVRLAASDDGYVLTTHSTGQNPTWEMPNDGSANVTDDPPVNVSKSAAQVGVSEEAARADHKHDINTAIAVAVGATNAEGISAALARADHTHEVVDLAIPGQTQGDILYFDGDNWVTLPAGDDGYVLTTHDDSQDPTWEMPSGGVQVSAGTQIVTNGTLIFSNSNGVSFGINGQTLTASHNGISNINISGGTTSNNLSAFVFSNSNNVSFGLNGSTITATVSQSVQTQSNVQGISAGTQVGRTGDIVFSNSNNITFGMSDNATVTASYNFNLSAGTTSNNLNAVVFSNSNNVSFGLNGSTVTATISVPAQTNQTVGLYALGNTTQNSSTTLDARSLSFNGLGAATIGYSNGSIQVSAPVQTAQTQSNIQAIYDGANSISTGTIHFTNANGVSFSINGQTISGSVAAQTNQTVGLYGLGNTTQNSSTTLDARSLSFNGLGMVTVGYSNGSIQLSATQTVQTSNVVVPSAGTQTATSGTVVYSNSNNITFGMSGSSRITASYNFNVSAGTTSNNLNSIVFSNSNNVSFGMNGSTVTATISVPAQTNQTLGLYATGNTTQNSSTTLDARSLTYNGIGALSVGYSNGSVQLSAPSVSQLSATGNVSISVNSDTISIGVPVYKVSNLIWPQNPWQTNFAVSNASLSLQHFNPALNITASQLNLLMSLSGNTNSSGALTISVGIYTMSQSTMSLASSNSREITWTSGSQTTNTSLYGGNSGVQYRTVSLANWAISAGDYVIGMWFRTTNDGTWRAYGQQGPTIVGALDSNQTNHYHHGFSTSSFTTAMIASVNVTNTNYVRTGADALQQPGLIFIGSI